MKTQTMILATTLAFSAGLSNAQIPDGHRPAQPSEQPPVRPPRPFDGAPGQRQRPLDRRNQDGPNEPGRRNPADQDEQPLRPRPRLDGRPEQAGVRPVPPIIAALDANDDGEISNDEITNASAALKKLDRNGDGKITMDELRPTPPQVDQGGGRRPVAPPPQNQGGDKPSQDLRPRPPVGGDRRPEEQSGDPGIRKDRREDATRRPPIAD